MKKYMVLLLAVLLVFSFATTSLASTEDFDGVIMPSAEEYLDGIPLCHGFHTQDNYYAYKYIDCGREHDGDGNNAIWALFEEYAEWIVSTGYFELAHRDDKKTSWTVLCLKYTGPEEYLQETFTTQRSLPADYAIVISSLYGDTSVFYSKDIMTTNLEKTLERLGYAPPSGEGDCTICKGTGKCTKCHGSGYIYQTVLVDGKHETVHTRCDGYLCTFGSCMSCGGDGSY